MMLNSKLCSPEYLERARYAQTGAGILAALVGGYLLFCTGAAVREVWSARRALVHGKNEFRQLSRQAAVMKRQIEVEPKLGAGGVEAFAVAFAGWAKARNVNIESLSPEGAPAPTEVKIGESKLGTWNANSIRVKGHGEFSRVTGLLNRLCRPGMSVELNSFSLKSAGKAGEIVNFDLAVTVYDKSVSEALAQ